MLKHIILWTLKPELTAEEKAAVSLNIKKQLEALDGKIEGLVSIKVRINELPTSNVDVMLDSTFDSPEALAGYACHPAHQEVANTKVRPFTVSRACLDFEL